MTGTPASAGAQRLRVAAPQDRDQRATAAYKRCDRQVGDGLPAAAAVRPGDAGPYCQDPVEQQDPSVGPRRQVAMLGRVPDVVGELPVDVGQAARQRTDVSPDGEATGRPDGPAWGTGSWPTMSTRTSASGLAEGAQDVLAGRQEPSPLGASRAAGNRRSLPPWAGPGRAPSAQSGGDEFAQRCRAHATHSAVRVMPTAARRPTARRVPGEHADNSRRISEKKCHATLARRLDGEIQNSHELR